MHKGKHLIFCVYLHYIYIQRNNSVHTQQDLVTHQLGTVLFFVLKCASKIWVLRLYTSIALPRKLYGPEI